MGVFWQAALLLSTTTDHRPIEPVSVVWGSIAGRLPSRRKGWWHHKQRSSAGTAALGTV